MPCEQFSCSQESNGQEITAPNVSVISFLMALPRAMAIGPPGEQAKQ